MPTVDEKAGEFAVLQETGQPYNYSELKVLVADSGVQAENVSEQVQQALLRARKRLDAARGGLNSLVDAGRLLDDDLTSLFERIADYAARISAFQAAQADSDIDTTLLDDWEEVLHRRFLTDAGDFSTYLQNAENTVSTGDATLVAWVPSYTRMRDG